MRDAPGGRLTLSGYRDIADRGSAHLVARTFGNTLNALFAAHDDARLPAGRGGACRVRDLARHGLDLVARARVEHQDQRRAGGALRR